MKSKCILLFFLTLRILFGEELLKLYSSDGNYYVSADNDWKKLEVNAPVILELEKNNSLRIQITELPLEPLADLTSSEILDFAFSRIEDRMFVAIIHPKKSQSEGNRDSSAIVFDTIRGRGEDQVITRCIFSVVKSEVDVLNILASCENDDIPDGLFEVIKVANSLTFVKRDE